MAWLSNHNPHLHGCIGKLNTNWPDWDFNKAPLDEPSAVTKTMELIKEYKDLHERMLCDNCSKRMTVTEVERFDYLANMLIGLLHGND
jgi:hypothetical protein